MQATIVIETSPVPDVWSLEGPLPEVGVAPFIRVQSKASDFA